MCAMIESAGYYDGSRVCSLSWDHEIEVGYSIIKEYWGKGSGPKREAWL